MTSNREFQEHLQTGRVSDAISCLIGQLVEIEVNTELAAMEPATSPTQIQTQISLITGKATTAVSAELLQNESYQKLLDLHTAQVVATTQAMQGYLRSLQELLPHFDNTAVSPLLSAVPGTAITDGQDRSIDLPTHDSSNSEVAAPVPIVTPSEPTPPLPAPTNRTESSLADRAVDAPTVEPLVPDVQSVPSAPADLPTVEPLPSPAPTTMPEMSADAAGSTASNLPLAAAVASAGIISSGMAATVAQAGSPKLEEADSIPNKFDQVLKSVGFKDEAEEHPFIAVPQAESSPPVTPPAIAGDDALQLLNESDEEWDDWLLEEDEILSELSQASQEVAKDKIPDWDESWFGQPSGAIGRASGQLEEWEQFIPEYTDVDVATNKGQANVERFRQNLVDDPKLMNELLAELDEIEKLNKDRHEKP